MFGKHFASMYQGSMFGKPAAVWAVWGYVIANMRPSKRDGVCYVELNPTLLSCIFSESVEKIREALEILESPDRASRSPDEDGRRLVCLNVTRHDGPMQFRVVNGGKYRAMRDEEIRREQTRQAVTRYRQKARSSHVGKHVSQSEPRKAQAEAEADTEAEALSSSPTEKTPSPRQRGSGSRPSEDPEFYLLWNQWEKKVKRPNALAAFAKAKAKPNWPGVAAVAEKARLWQKTEGWSKEGRQYQPYLATWLNAEGWEDELPADPDLPTFGAKNFWEVHAGLNLPDHPMPPGPVPSAVPEKLEDDPEETIQ